MGAVKFSILLFTHCTVQIDCWRLAPLIGSSIFSNPFSPRGSYRIMDLKIMRPYQRISFAKRIQFVGYNSILLSAQNWRIRSTVSIRPESVSRCRKRSYNHESIFLFRFHGTASTRADWRWVTAFKFPCETRVGENIASGVIKYCELRDPVSSSNSY